MEKFRITTHHTVYVDTYEEGEGKQVNVYTLESIQKGPTLRQAIQNHFFNVVYLPFDYDKADTNEEKDCIFWSCLVDEDNNEPYKIDVEEWKQGKKELFSNNIQIYAEELKQVKFD